MPRGKIGLNIPCFIFLTKVDHEKKNWKERAVGGRIFSPTVHVEFWDILLVKKKLPENKSSIEKNFHFDVGNFTLKNFCPLQKKFLNFLWKKV